MAHDYIEDALCEHYSLDRLFYEYLQEQFGYESEFMLLALENNIILEAEIKNNIENFWDKFPEAINKLYQNFKLSTMDLVNGNQEFIDKELSKISGYDFSKLRITTIPYWNNTTLNQNGQEIEKLMTHIRNKVGMPKPEEIQNYTSTSNIEKYGEFSKLTIPGKSLGESIKIKFLYGHNVTEPFTPIELRGEEFKNICMNSMYPYVQNYSQTIPEIMRATNTLKSEVNKIKRTKSSLKEAYCHIEEAFYKDTDLFYCINHELLFEAEGETTQNVNQPQSPTTNTTQIEPKGKLNKVVDEENTKEGKTESCYDKYLCSACKIINLAIAAQMTSKETIYKSYMQVLRGVYNTKKGPDVPNETKETENKK